MDKIFLFFQSYSAFAHLLGERDFRQALGLTHMNPLIKSVYAVGTQRTAGQAQSRDM